MKYFQVVLTFVFISTLACGGQPDSTEVNSVKIDSSLGDQAEPSKEEANKSDELINPTGTKLLTRFLAPTGYKRLSVEKNSFGDYLRNLPLKPHGSEVMMYDGSIKSNFNVYHAVVDLEIGDKNLHQCADAVMRLRGEFLWETEQFDKIHFNFTNGFRVDYSEWMKGKRVQVRGNKSYWINSRSPSNTYQDFWNYMEVIFTYAGTLSLSKELKSVSMEDMQIGDVFILGGSPGHSVIVVDMAMNEQTGEKLYMLAQSYMPAQETQILQNPNDAEISPWYRLNDNNKIDTPEWIFEHSDLMRFSE